MSQYLTDNTAEKDKVKQAADCCRKILNHVNQAVKESEDKQVWLFFFLISFLLYAVPESFLFLYPVSTNFSSPFLSLVCYSLFLTACFAA